MGWQKQVQALADVDSIPAQPVDDIVLLGDAQAGFVCVSINGLESLKNNHSKELIDELIMSRYKHAKSNLERISG